MKVWLGFEQPSTGASDASGLISKLESNIGEFGTYQSGIADLTSHADHESYLQNNGFSAEDATATTDRIKQAFSDDDSSGSVWDEYNDYVQNDAESYLDLENRFGKTQVWGSNVEAGDGTAAAGIKVYENAGVSKAGIQVPQGAVEIFGREVHFSQSDAAKGDPGDINWSNLRTVESTPVDVGESVTIQADGSNSTGQDLSVTVQLVQQGSVIDSQDVTIDDGETKTVEFVVVKDRQVCYNYTIGGLPEITVCWEEGDLIQ